jgi:hypothetical protein
MQIFLKLVPKNILFFDCYSKGYLFIFKLGMCE